MNTWSNVCRLCDGCGAPYAPRKNISYEDKYFCSLPCQEDYIDRASHVTGTHLPEMGEYNPSGDLFVWAGLQALQHERTRRNA
jgi:hypothetical protein